MLGLSPTTTWSEVDRLLALALTQHDADLCPGGCGHYLDETSTMDGWHEAHSIHCDACAALEESRKQESEPGSLAYVLRIED